ncbi:hypothetical protein [Amycolatopsis palatopharyngis]|uniref:hypothetical protein n=1 Tax=Amycolatopsis palatopharyngis TaxID=187982 RepID=UPI000E253F0D|nr:hypothetical protein [Amycolatopsis palatopharyngis]
MSSIRKRLGEPLSTTDKRLVTIFGLLFVTAFALVNYGTVRAATTGCTEITYGGPTFASTVQSGVAVTVATKRVCPVDGQLSTTDLFLSLGATLPALVFSAGALLLLWRFLWGAVRPGLHAPVTPGRLRTLGWFVLIGGPVSEGLGHFWTYELAESLLGGDEYRMGDYSAWLQELQMDFPWWSVFAGVSALVVAKLLRIEVRMGEELEGTI